MMNYAYLDVISVRNQLGPNPVLMMIGACISLSLLGYVSASKQKARSRKYIMCTSAVLAVGMLLMLIGALWIYPTGKTIITATIADDAKFADVSRNYEIVSTRNGVYELKQKNRQDAKHFVCERCGKEIEVGPPWLCGECKGK